MRRFGKGTALSMSEICWRSRIPIENKQAVISGPVVARGPWSERYSVLQSERGKRLKVGGRRRNDKSERLRLRLRLRGWRRDDKWQITDKQ
jgi:hypothetical protein